MYEKLNAKTAAIMNERFGRDNVIALATIHGDKPAVRGVNGYYEDGCFYVVTYALSGKMQQLGKNPHAAISGEWFTANGIGENLGHVLRPENAAIMERIRAAFASWYDNGHTNEADENTCLLRVKLTDGILFSHGTRYEIDFTE